MPALMQRQGLTGALAAPSLRWPTTGAGNGSYLVMIARVPGVRSGPLRVVFLKAQLGAAASPEASSLNFFDAHFMRIQIDYWEV